MQPTWRSRLHNSSTNSMQTRILTWLEAFRIIHRRSTCSCLRRTLRLWHQSRSLQSFLSLTRLPSQWRIIGEQWRRPQMRVTFIRMESSVAVLHWTLTRQIMSSSSCSRWSRTWIGFTWSWTSPKTSKMLSWKKSLSQRPIQLRQARSLLTRWWLDGSMCKSTRSVRITPLSHLWSTRTLPHLASSLLHEKESMHLQFRPFLFTHKR